MARSFWPVDLRLDPSVPFSRRSVPSAGQQSRAGEETTRFRSIPGLNPLFGEDRDIDHARRLAEKSKVMFWGGSKRAQADVPLLAWDEKQCIRGNHAGSSPLPEQRCDFRLRFSLKPRKMASRFLRGFS